MNYVRPPLACVLILMSCGLFPRTLSKLAAIPLTLHNGAAVRAGKIAADGPSTQPDAEDRFAWDEFASLVHPSIEGDPKKHPMPEWTAWSNKCQAGLTGSCQTVPPHTDSKVPVDASSAEIPRQVLLDFGESEQEHKENEFVQSYVQAPQLASVLFNPEAAASIRRSNLGQKSMLDLAVHQLDAGVLAGAGRRLPEGTFELGSEIVKLIWEILPATDDLHLFDPANEPIEQNSNQLLNVAFWQARYFVNSDTTKPCAPALPAYGSPRQAVTVPINCFYWFKVRGNETCTSLSQDVVHVWCQPPLKNHDFYAVLVGFHVMKLVSTNPNWIWMTFYWTKDTNDSETGSEGNWTVPWNHFHEYSATAIREEGPLGHENCFNPYLEGWGRNGLKANCLSCHSFSAYSPQGSKLKGGTELGVTYPYPLSQRKQDEYVYFAGSIQTALVWSISTNQDSTTQALLNAFESAVASAILDQLKLR